MKKLCAVHAQGSSSAMLARLGLSLLVTVALALTFWAITLPAARAQALSPLQLIQQGLPPGRTLGDASKSQVLAAVCAAVRQHREMAPDITQVAVRAHHEYAGDIVATVLRCSPNLDCDFAGTIVVAAVRVAQEDASIIDDAALAVAPDCADAIQQATEQAANIPGEGPAEGGGFNTGGPIGAAPLPGTVGGGGGGGFNPQEQVILVCDNGTQRQVPENNLGAFLSSHPGSFVGSCQATPTTNR